jgi:hypothetical protein
MRPNTAGRRQSPPRDRRGPDARVARRAFPMGWTGRRGHGRLPFHGNRPLPGGGAIVAVRHVAGRFGRRWRRVVAATAGIGSGISAEPDRANPRERRAVDRRRERSRDVVQAAQGPTTLFSRSSLPGCHRPRPGVVLERVFPHGFAQVHQATGMKAQKSRRHVRVHRADDQTQGQGRVQGTARTWPGRPGLPDHWRGALPPLVRRPERLEGVPPRRRAGAARDRAGHDRASLGLQRAEPGPDSILSCRFLRRSRPNQTSDRPRRGTSPRGHCPERPRVR